MQGPKSQLGRKVMSNKSVFKKFLKGTPAKQKPAVPRSKQEINQQYTQFAQLLGDKYVKQEGLKKEIEQIMQAIDNLGAELNERNRLDTEAETKAKQTPTEEPEQPVSGAV
jgi:hypothetical protein